MSTVPAMNAAPAGARARLEEVAEHVHAYIQPDGGWCLNNAGVIAQGGESVLVDTAATEHRARALRRAALGVGAVPRIVVNTHSHGDHTFGNFVFPEAVVVGHAGTRTEIQQVGTHLTGLWPQVCWGDIELSPPTVTYEDRLTLHIGSVRAEVTNMGTAHTVNDTIVWLPEQRVLFTGDLVMRGVTPFIPMGSLSGALAALQAMRELDPLVVVPGHGPVSGTEALEETEQYLLWLGRLARSGLAAELTPLQVAREADFGPWAELLDSERLVPNLHRAYAELRGAPPGSPVDMTALFHEMADFHGGLPDCSA